MLINRSLVNQARFLFNTRDLYWQPWSNHNTQIMYGKSQAMQISATVRVFSYRLRKHAHFDSYHSHLK